MKKLTHEEFVEMVNIKYDNNIIIESKYINSREKIKCYCVKHEKRFNIVASSLLRKKAVGCGECVKENIISANSFTNNDFIEQIHQIYDNDITVLSEYNGSHNDVSVRCNIHNVIWTTKAYVLLKGAGCCKCKSERNRNRQITPKSKFINDLKAISPHIKVIGSYEGMHKHVLCQCNVHNIEWNALPRELIKGSGCKLCGIEKIKDKKTLSKEQYDARLKIINPNVEIAGVYTNTSVKTKFICKVCKNEWFALPSNLIYGKTTGCPNCQEYSKGETAISEFLTNKNINFMTHHTFDGLNGVGNKPLSYDFYLPMFNVLVEFQGIQHKKPTKFSNDVTDDEANERFKIQQEHDKRKRNYAMKHNIELLEIWYYEYDNIEDILSQKLHINNSKKSA